MVSGHLYHHAHVPPIVFRAEVCCSRHPWNPGRMDVEHMELPVLRGSSQTIARCRPIIHSEYHQHMKTYGTSFELLESHAASLRPPDGTSSWYCSYYWSSVLLSLVFPQTGSSQVSCCSGTTRCVIVRADVFTPPHSPPVPPPPARVPTSFPCRIPWRFPGSLAGVHA